MPSNHEAEREVGYPKLSREQIDLIIDQLLFTVRQRDLGRNVDLAEQTIAHLTGFYTRRWGLPPAVTGRAGRTRELVESWTAGTSTAAG